MSKVKNIDKFFFVSPTRIYRQNGVSVVGSEMLSVHVVDRAVSGYLYFSVYRIVFV